MIDYLPVLILLAGIAQLCILIASAMVPSQLRWAEELQHLPRLHRQMHWVYAGYVVLSIIAFALISIIFNQEIVESAGLGRAFCIYVAVFWSIRIALQGVFDLKPYLDTWWKRLGCHLLTLVFAVLIIVYVLAAVY